jgi:hypothetical protein
MGFVQSRSWCIVTAIGVVSVLASCATERVVYRNGRNFQAPSAAASGFLGYDDEASKLTVCGNCHVSHQGTWKDTRHAHAWQTLQANAGKQVACEGCHTVTQRGNASPDSLGGWVATQDSRYHDVQCENCHGPGLQHVENPEATQPLATIAVGSLSTGCGECHNGAHHPFVEEWKQSAHATPLSAPLNSTDPTCVGCHSGQGALKAWGIQANYLEKNAPNAQHQGITCAVCHDPHSNRASAVTTGSQTLTGGQLRFAVGVPNTAQNLCMKCHQRRAAPDGVNSRTSPHSPEGPLLLGENVGYWFDGAQIDSARIVSTHGSSANPKLCATCHVTSFTVTDKLTGNFTWQATGHLFEAIPCLDANGIPVVGTCNESARTFKGCVGSGCHGSEQVARSALSVARTRIANLSARLKSMIDVVRSREIVGNDNKFTSAEGAEFNYQLAILPGSVVHNPFMVEALLTASITEMNRRYSIPLPTDVELTNVLRRPPSP